MRGVRNPPGGSVGQIDRSELLDPGGHHVEIRRRVRSQGLGLTDPGAGHDTDPPHLSPTHREVTGSRHGVRRVEDEIDALVPGLSDGFAGQGLEHSPPLEVGMGGRVDGADAAHSPAVRGEQVPSHEGADAGDSTFDPREENDGPSKRIVDVLPTPLLRGPLEERGLAESRGEDLEDPGQVLGGCGPDSKSAIEELLIDLLVVADHPGDPVFGGDQLGTGLPPS